MKVLSILAPLLTFGLSLTITTKPTTRKASSAGQSPTTTATDEQPMTAKFRNLIGAKNQCSLDTDALYNDSNLAIPYQAWETELLDNDDLDDDICVEVSQDRFDCTLDSSSILLGTHVNVVNACEYVGGSTYLQTSSIYCKIDDHGRNIQFHIRFVQIPHCLATRCIWATQHDLQFADKAVERYENSLSFFFDSVECTSSAFGWNALLTSVLMAGVLLLLLLA